MNTEIDLQKIMKLVLKKWKLVAIFCLIGALLIGIYSANFATKTYSSSVKFFVYAVETQQELSDSTLARNAASNTSKMNYAMQTTLIKNTTRITHIKISANVFQSRQKRILPL